MSYVDEVLERVREKNASEPEFLQAVTEVLNSLRPVIDANEEVYRREALLERLCEPDRQFKFRVPWVDDKGQVQVNTGYRVLDGAVATYSAADGVQPQSETVWRQADKYNVPRIGYVSTHSQSLTHTLTRRSQSSISRRI